MSVGWSAGVCFLLVSLGVALAMACGGGARPATPTAAPAAAGEPMAAPPEATSSPPPAAAAATADGQRVLARVRHLADDIGLRQSGTPSEQQAVDYIADQLRSFGYNVSVQDFPISNE